MRGVVIVLAALAAAAHASPTRDPDRARQSFKARDWQSAIPVLNTLLYPRIQLDQQEDEIEAHVLLGAALLEVGDRDRAQEEFEKALEIDPERSISTLTFSTGAVRLFEQTKDQLQARIERDAARKRLAEAAERLEEYRKSLIVYETRPYYVNFVPFGAGQFQQRRTGAGILFAITQGVTGATSAGIFLYLAGKYGLVSDAVPLAEGPRVRLLQQIEIGTGIAFLGFYAWGVVDSLLSYKPRQQIEGDDSLIPRDLLVPEETAPRQTSLRDRIRVGPIITSSGVGIGIGWEN
jgi:tetratricopeptide (TPR) repeat protein